MNLSILKFATILSVVSPVIAGEITDDFSAPELSEEWSAAKGNWTVKDGKLHGAELVSDNHAAVLNYRAPHSDTKTKISFEFNGSKEFHLSFNHPKGHLYRIVVTATGARINLDKDKKNPASKALKLAATNGTFTPGEVYTLTLENAGDKVTAEFSNGVTVEARHERLAMKKTGYRLIIKGDGMIFDDFQILSKS